MGRSSLLLSYSIFWGQINQFPSSFWKSDPLWCGRHSLETSPPVVACLCHHLRRASFVSARLHSQVGKRAALTVWFHLTRLGKESVHGGFRFPPGLSGGLLTYRAFSFKSNRITAISSRTGVITANRTLTRRHACLHSGLVSSPQHDLPASIIGFTVQRGIPQRRHCCVRGRGSQAGRGRPGSQQWWYPAGKRLHLPTLLWSQQFRTQVMY